MENKYEGRYEDAYQEEIDALRAKVSELEAELAAARVDAERYRWLAGEAESVLCRFFDWETNGGDYGERDESLDAAIDAARSQREGGGV